MKEFTILGVKVQAVNHTLVKELILTFLNSSGQHQLVTVNPEFVILALKNEKFKNILNDSSLATIDGTGIIWALQLEGHEVSLNERLTGVQLTEIILELASAWKFKVMFCLSPDGLTETTGLAKQIKNKYPLLSFQAVTKEQAVLQAQIFTPDIVLVNFGAPEQELWIAEHLSSMPSAKIAVGVGGTFDFLSGQIKRAPKFLRSFGLEWFWRLLLKPKRFVRIFRAVVVFPILVLKKRYLTQKQTNQA